MSTHRRATLVLALLSTLLLAPSVASAGSLLSGYGGPGQGSQVILGSGLVNVGGGGGGSGSGASPAPSARSIPEARSGTGGGGRSHGANRSASKPTPLPLLKARPSLAKTALNAYPLSSATDAQAVADASDPLGISGADLIYILVAAGALAFTGLLTRELTHTSDRNTDRH